MLAMWPLVTYSNCFEIAFTMAVAFLWTYNRYVCV